ncbi:uncharacterized protein LOC118279529 [Spodoptera frugiperda]|uniref:Uncharacterized protein LOC118279529 n=1 Tax=Spodoptera frugiperda TaxID=7108 RepID=A0A9R0DIK0_SPOFR|nr:uncharacterized protein LOC118279529 [Spodoptera frugiperda]
MQLVLAFMLCALSVLAAAQHEPAASDERHVQLGNDDDHYQILQRTVRDARPPPPPPQPVPAPRPDPRPDPMMPANRIRSIYNRPRKPKPKPRHYYRRTYYDRSRYTQRPQYSRQQYSRGWYGRPQQRRRQQSPYVFGSPTFDW